jgi:hypothetical protein
MEPLREVMEEVYELRCCRPVDEERRGSERSARAGCGFVGGETKSQVDRRRSGMRAELFTMLQAS